LWNFGDGSSETGCGDVLHVYAEGTFDVSLTVTANGCTTTETFSDYITVIPLPIADFTALPSQISISNTLVTFDNSSNHATTYFWSFGDDGASSTEFEPSHLYPEALGGVYEVVLIATNDLGCADTAYATIVYQDQLIFYVPNIFTPNGDGMNDVFNPSFTGRINPADFNMKIFNRWGEVIYDTYDINAGWNGKYLELLVEDGVYIWRVEFGDSTNGERYTFEGHVTILK
jgi:gliding motility-associated-like protein